MRRKVAGNEPRAALTALPTGEPYGEIRSYGSEGERPANRPFLPLYSAILRTGKHRRERTPIESRPSARNLAVLRLMPLGNQRRGERGHSSFHFHEDGRVDPGLCPGV
jgi:hypothetical protein